MKFLTAAALALTLTVPAHALTWEEMERGIALGVYAEVCGAKVFRDDRHWVNKRAIRFRDFVETRWHKQDLAHPKPLNVWKENCATTFKAIEQDGARLGIVILRDKAGEAGARSY